MSTQALTHAFPKISLSHAFHLLLAAGLGSALMFGLEVTTFRYLTSESETLEEQVEVQDIRIKGLESDVKSKGQQLSKALEENQSLSLLNEDLRSEIEASKNQVSSLEDQLNSIRSEFEKVQRDKDIFFAHSEVLSKCVFDGRKLRESTSSLPMRIREAGFNLPAVATEVALMANSLNEFHNSWAMGNCKEAIDIAEQHN